MSTSGSTDYSLTALGIITKAFNRIGVAQEGESLSADMLADGMSSLNLIVKAWGAKPHLWLNTEGSVTLTASQASYSLSTLFGVKPMRVTSVRRQLTSGSIETSLTELARQQYFDQPNKTSTGVPVQFYYDPQVTTGTLYVWPTPDGTTAGANTLKVTWLRKIEDFDASTDDPDLPQEWLNALTWALAEDLMTEYPVNDPRLAAKVERNAGLSLLEIQAFDTEPASLFMQPDGQWNG